MLLLPVAQAYCPLECETYVSQINRDEHPQNGAQSSADQAAHNPPCTMNNRMMTPREAPIVRNIAISGPFSATAITRVETIFTATDGNDGEKHKPRKKLLHRECTKQTGLSFRHVSISVDGSSSIMLLGK
jgi:hypothetical protein